MRRFLLIGLCALLLAGCGLQKENSNTVTIWHWMTDRDDAFQKLAQQYEQHAGIKVAFELYAPSDAYSQKIIAAAQARVLPDIFGILGEKKTFASFVKNGFVADLTAEFAAQEGEWEQSLFTEALDVNRFKEGNTYGVKPGIYGVPIDVTNIQMLYNKKLLQHAGITGPPRTFEEFLEDGEKLKSIGISGLVSGWGEAWMIDCFASNYAFNIMGEDKVMATYRGEVAYTDEDWIKVLNVFKQMADSRILATGIVTKGNKYAEQDFALERAAFAFNGSWCVNVYRDMNPDLAYGVMLPPRISDEHPMKIWGGAGSSFVVNKRSANKQKAIDFLQWLTAEKQQAFLAAETKNLPANKKALSSIDPILSGFGRGADHTTHPKVWEVNEYPQVIEKFVKGIQSIIIGDKTPRQVAREAQEMKEKITAREQRRHDR